MLDFTQMEEHLSTKLRGEIVENVKTARLKGATADLQADHSARVNILNQQLASFKTSLVEPCAQNIAGSIQPGRPNPLLQVQRASPYNSEQVLRVESLQAQLAELQESLGVGVSEHAEIRRGEPNPLLQLQDTVSPLSSTSVRPSCLAPGFHSHHRPSCLSPGLAAVLWKEGHDAQDDDMSVQFPNKWDIMAQVWVSQDVPSQDVPSGQEEPEELPLPASLLPKRHEINGPPDEQPQPGTIPPLSERERWIRKHSQNRQASVGDQERWIREHQDWREVLSCDPHFAWHSTPLHSTPLHFTPLHSTPLAHSPGQL
jgi:hypothetical protein